MALEGVAFVYAFDRDAVRADMGDDPFASAWAEGRAMTLEQAVEYALKDERSVN